MNIFFEYKMDVLCNTFKSNSNFTIGVYGGKQDHEYVKDFNSASENFIYELHNIPGVLKMCGCNNTESHTVITNTNDKH